MCPLACSFSCIKKGKYMSYNNETLQIECIPNGTRMTIWSSL